MREADQRRLLDALMESDRIMLQYKIKIVNNLMAGDFEEAEKVRNSAARLGFEYTDEEIDRALDRGVEQAGMSEAERRVMASPKALRGQAVELVEDPALRERVMRGTREHDVGVAVEYFAQRAAAKDPEQKRAWARKYDEVVRNAGGLSRMLSDWQRDQIAKQKAENEELKKKGEPVKKITSPNAGQMWNRRIRRRTTELLTRERQREAAD
jgi:hypothetical protein